MDAKVKSGDTVLDLSGNTVYVNGIQEVLQYVMFCIRTPRGSFRYSPDFGCSRIGEIRTSRDVKNTQAKLREAVACVEGVELSVLNAENVPEGVRVSFNLKYREDEINEEVILS